MGDTAAGRERIRQIAENQNFLDFISEEGGSVLSEDEVLARTIPWDQLGSGYLSSEELEMIKKYDSSREQLAGNTQAAFMNENGAKFAKIFLILLARLQRDEYVQYVLTLLDEMLNDDRDKALLFYKLEGEHEEGIPELPFGPLYGLLRRKKEDWYISKKASTICTTFLIEFPAVSKGNMVFFFDWLAQRLREDTSIADRIIAITCLQSLLRINKYRLLFMKQGGLERLISLVKYAPSSAEQAPAKDRPSFQVIYQTIFCIWCLSFHPTVREHMDSAELITNLCHICKNISYQKVVRLAVATLTNTLDIGRNAEYMIGAGLLKSLQTLEHLKPRGDEDVRKNLEKLTEALETKYTELSSFDMYKSELVSGNLDWTPAHRSEKFWRANIVRFEENDYQVLHILKELLEKSRDPKVLSVACFDVGEFVRFHPRGKAIAQHIGFKTSFMKLLNHKSGEVRKEALLSLQKLMVVNWEYLTV